MSISLKISIIFTSVMLASPTVLASDRAASGSEGALERATAAVLASGAVPGVPRGVDGEQLFAALQDYPICGGSMETHARSLVDRFGEQVVLATMNLIVTDARLSLVDLSQQLVVLRMWVQGGQVSADKVAALVAALRGQAEAIVVGRTAELAAELPARDLAAQRAYFVDRLRRDLVRVLAGNGSTRAVREVRDALRSTSPGERSAAAVVARTLPGQPLRAEVAALCTSDSQDVRDIACEGT